MRRQRVALFCTLALLGALPLPAAAQQSQMRGTWTLNREQSEDINAKINTAVARMNLVVRQIARPRLRGTNVAYPQLVITHDAQNVRVDMQGRPSVSSPANGQPVLWQRQTGRTCTEVKGDCVRVTTEWEQGHLEQTFAAEDGQRVNVFSVSADGNTLTMSVTVTSPRLPQPLTYRLVYNRAS
jgi:hypothetical protein